MTEEDFEGLGLVDLIALLEEVPEPPPPSLWPQTWGWVALALFAIAAVWFVRRKHRERRAASAYRRVALAAVQAAGSDAATLAELLRRTALSAYPRTDVAGLSGDDWLAFLDNSSGNIGFQSEVGRVLTQAPYRDVPCPPELPGLVAGWIKAHKVETAGQTE